MISSLLINLSLLVPQGQGTAQQGTAQDIHPLAKDKTGINWVYPFTKALAKAKKEKRLLLMVPLAGGTDSTGNW